METYTKLTSDRQFLLGSLCFTLSGAGVAGAIIQSSQAIVFLIFAGAIGIVAMLLLSGHMFEALDWKGAHIKLLGQQLSSVTELPLRAAPRLSPELVKERKAEIQMGSGVQGTHHLTGVHVSLNDPAAARPLPGSDIASPVLRLDKNYCILDWNDAFGLVFDNVLEGRTGRPISDWIIYLDNYKEVQNHFETRFCSEFPAPRADAETIYYTSSLYGAVEAVKRMYQVSALDGTVDSWICVLDLKINSANAASLFYSNLIALLRDDLMWSEYAVSYDRVLMNTKVYPRLISTLIGEGEGAGILPPLSESARILDLGAGTGNVVLKLMQESPQRDIVALDKNRFMLNLLRIKCAGFAKMDRHSCGVIALKQDITNLHGLPSNHFDAVILNNVLYSVTDPRACLREAYRVLKPGGEIRLAGPKRDTDLRKLFQLIRGDLEASGQWDELKADFDRVDDIHKYGLSKMLFKWNANEVAAMLHEAKFVGVGGGAIWRTSEAYEGQAMMLRAVKTDA